MTISLAEEIALRLNALGVRVTFHPDTPQQAICETCNGLGVVSPDLRHIPHGERHLHPAFGKLFPCPNHDCKAGAEARARRDESRLKSAGLPPEYAHLTFDSWEHLHPELQREKWLAAYACKVLSDSGMVSVYELNHSLGGQAAPKILERLRLPKHMDILEERNQLVLYGAPNMGKTGLAAAVANARRAAGKPALYIRCYDIFTEINRRKDAEEYPRSEDVLDNFKRAPFLIIDEAGIAGETESRLDRFEAIVRHRAAHHLPTLLTTNYTPAEFEAAWGTQSYAILSRQGFWIPVTGLPLRSEITR